MKLLATALPGLIGLLALAGWIFDNETLKRFDLRLVAMNPVTAIGLILASAAAMIGQLGAASALLRRIALAFATLCVALGALKLAQVGLHWQVGPDAWLFADKLAAGPGPVNRIAPNTAANFVMIGCALILLQTKRSAFAAQLLAVLAALVSTMAIVGYVYGIRTLYGVGMFIPMAIHTATSFLLLAGAVLCMRPNEGLMATVTDNSPAGRAARIMLACAVIFPIAIGWLRLVGERAGLYEPDVGASIFVMSNILVFALLIWWNARQLLEADALRRSAEQHLRHLATHDFLTGLANRSLFMERLEHRVQMARRHPALLFAVLYLDLDGFKQVNDNFGHHAGDELLCQVATELRVCCRTTDLVARLGGDEFAILAEIVSREDDARLLAERVLAALSHTFPLGPTTLTVNVSIGIALFNGHYATADEILRDADKALYVAKLQGKGRFVHYDTVPSVA